MSEDRISPVRDEDRIEDVSAEDSDPYTATPIKGYRERKLRIDFGGAYKGVWVEVWTNCPRGLIKRLVSDDPDVVDEAFCRFVLDHNLAEEDGTPLPHPLTVDALEGIDNTLYVRILRMGIEAMQKAAGVSKS